MNNTEQELQALFQKFEVAFEDRSEVREFMSMEPRLQNIWLFLEMRKIQSRRPSIVIPVPDVRIFVALVLAVITAIVTWFTGDSSTPHIGGGGNGE